MAARPPNEGASGSTQRRARRWLGRRSLGFTLIEVLLSLSASLVLIATVAAISRMMSANLNDEARIATSEMALRTAVDRLRSDLQRASFMSTANIRADPSVVRPTSGFPTTLTSGITGLSGLVLNSRGSRPNTVAGGVNFSDLNALAPDSIDIAGNFTTVDRYAVRLIEDGAGASGCTRIWLNASKPSIWRVRVAGGVPEGGTTAAASDALANAFQPVAGRQFIVRLTDPQGNYQFLPTCAGSTAAAGTDATGDKPYVDVVANSITRAAATGSQTGVTGFGVGSYVNPVQWVRWSIRSTSTNAEYTPLNSDPVAGDAASGYGAKFDLVRQYLDASKNEVGTPELVAEYAVDLKFAFTVDSNTTDSTFTGVNPTISTLGFTADGTTTSDNSAWAPDLTASASTAAYTIRGPQRIRAVRVRLATRSPYPDRGSNINASDAGFIYRYCTTTAASLASCTQFARVRTMTVEAALPNQARSFY